MTRSAAFRTSSMTSGGALVGEPVSNGGSGSYSILSWILGDVSPAMRAASVRAMSMPEETPAAVISVREGTLSIVFTRSELRERRPGARRHRR